MGSALGHDPIYISSIRKWYVLKTSNLCKYASKRCESMRT